MSDRSNHPEVEIVPRGSIQPSLRPLGKINSFVLKSEDLADGITTRRYEANLAGRRLSIIWEELGDGRTDEFAIQPAIE